MQTFSENRSGDKTLQLCIPDIVLKDGKLKKWNFVHCPPEAYSAVREN